MIIELELPGERYAVLKVLKRDRKAVADAMDAGAIIRALVDPMDGEPGCYERYLVSNADVVHPED